MVIFALSAILPAIATSALVFMRVLTAERRLDAIESRKEQVEVIQKSIEELRQDNAKNNARLVTLDESLVFLNNKWNARSKAEEAKDRKRREREQEEQDNDISAVPDAQQVIPFPPAQSPAQQQARRRWGEMPKQVNGG
jgi:DNA repair exonuclease SbcCD ATPase subunit